MYIISIVKDRAWTNGMTIPQFGSDPDCVFAAGYMSNSEGEILPSSIGLEWMILSPSTYSSGKYDILVDADDNGKYHELFDALDDFDVDSAGFFVIPDLLGTIMSVAGCFTALAVFRLSKRRRL
jgi:hypothetical protein